jgi:hypothetical protein
LGIYALNIEAQQCECRGPHHRIALHIVAQAGALEALPAYAEGMRYRNVTLIADANTWLAIGQKQFTILSGLFPTKWVSLFYLSQSSIRGRVYLCGCSWQSGSKRINEHGIDLG